MTEQQLITQCSQQNREAQQRLYEMYAPKMLGICYRYVCDPDLAQDLMHDGFITVFNKIEYFRAEGSFEGWMRRIFVNTALGYLRKQKTLNQTVQLDELIHQPGSEEISALEQMEAMELLKSLEQLPDGYRVVLNLFAIEGYSHREIAEMLDINEGTSRSQYARAKTYLSNILKQEEVNLR